MLTKITAAGCLVSSLIAAFVASKPEGYSNAEASLYAFMFRSITCLSLSTMSLSMPYASL